MTPKFEDRVLNLRFETGVGTVYTNKIIPGMIAEGNNNSHSVYVQPTGSCMSLVDMFVTDVNIDGELGFRVNGMNVGMNFKTSAISIKNSNRAHVVSSFTLKPGDILTTSLYPSAKNKHKTQNVSLQMRKRNYITKQFRLFGHVIDLGWI